MDNQKKKTNVKKRRHTSSSWEKKSQGIKDSVKSKISQNSKPITSVNSQTSVNNSTSINTQDTSKPVEPRTTATTTTEKTTPPADTNKAKKSSIWDKTPKSVKWIGKKTLKGIIPAASNKALDNINDTSSLYYDPNTGMYVDSADMQAIWQKNLANNNWAYNLPYSAFSKLPDALGEGISDVLRVKDPKARKIASDITNVLSYAIPYYGVGKSIYDIGDKVSNTIWDTNRDMDMLQDLRYGDLGYSNKWLLDNDTGSWLDEPAAFGESLWEGIKTASANDWVYNLTGLGRRSGFSEQSDVYKLGQQTVTKMMHKMLEDTNNFDPANDNSRATLNKFNMMNQLLKNSDYYWQFKSIKDSMGMNNDEFNAYLQASGIDENTYKGMEYAAKQLYNLGDNQERNGLRYDNSIISTQAPILQYQYARKQNPIQNDPLANLVGGSNVLDGYTRVGDDFINVETGKNLIPELNEVNQENTTTQEASTTTEATNTPATANTDTQDATVSTVSETPNYVKAGFYEFPKEYSRKTGYNFANNPYNIWK